MSISLLGSIIVITVILVAGLGVTLFWQLNKFERGTDRFDQATPATAQVIEIGTSIVGKEQVRISAALRFEVKLPSGETYKARSPWLVEPDHIGQIRLGETFPVKIDPQKRNIIYPDVAWAEYDWTRENEKEPIYED